MAKVILDKNEKQVTNYDIIDLHQTVNGESLFVIVDVEILDVRYYHNLKRTYEYSVEDLFRKCKISGEVDFEIVGKLDNSKKNELNKLETLEELAERLSIGIREENYKDGIIDGFREAEKTLYNEEEVLRIITTCKEYLSFGDEFDEKEWFKQFKKNNHQ